jgi:hypothetical protein
MRLITGFAMLCAAALACSPQENGSATDSTPSTDSTDSTTTTGTTDPTTGTDPTSTTDIGTTAATDTDPTTDTGESSSTTAAPVDDCAFLVGKVFLSDEELECGKGPNGVEMCPWRLTFTADTFDHQLSDFGLQGTYTCADGVIDAVDMQQLAHGGTIDAATGELVWDEIVYHPEG